MVMHSKVPSNIVRKLDSTEISDQQWKELKQSKAYLAQCPIWVMDQAGRVIDIYGNIASLIAKQNIGVVYLDYLQLLSPGCGGNIYEQVTNISRDLKSMAKELNIALICLCQLNRASESREKNEPRMSDLRDSGAIEQDADQIWLLHRPGYYDSEAQHDLAHLTVAKNRVGPTGVANLFWMADTMRFENLSMDEDLVE